MVPPSVEHRCAGDVDRLKLAPRESLKATHNLVGVIGVGCSECLRLRNVGGGLCAGDQIDVRGTIRQGCQGRWQQFLDKPGEGARSGRLYLPGTSPQAIMMASRIGGSPSCRCLSRESWNSQIREEDRGC